MQVADGCVGHTGERHVSVRYDSSGHVGDGNAADVHTGNGHVGNKYAGWLCIIES